MKIKKAHGDMLISVIVTCPHCKEVMDLSESQTFESLHSDGQLFKKIFREDGLGCDDLGEIIKCPECGCQVRVKNIYW